MPDEPAPLLSLDEAKQHLDVVRPDQDALIQGYIDAAIARLDGEEGWLRRSVRLTERVAYFDTFPSSMIRLPFPPVRAVISVQTRGNDAAWSTLDPTTWEFEEGLLMPVPGRAWPAPGASSRGVRISYSAGYDVLPPTMRVAVLLMVGDLYANRETAAAGPTVSAVPMSMRVEDLLQPFQVYR